MFRIVSFIWRFITNLQSQVSSVNKYDPPLDVVAARDHMTHLVYQLMQPQVVYDRLVINTNNMWLVICLFLSTKPQVKPPAWNEFT